MRWDGKSLHALEDTGAAQGHSKGLAGRRVMDSESEEKVALWDPRMSSSL